jgi:hypothetical protein
MSRPRWRNIARYTHCDLEIPATNLQGVLGDHDGVGMIWHRSPSHRAAHLSDLASKAEMEADEAETFASPIGDVCLLVREKVIRTPDPNAAWKLVRFALSALPSPVPMRCAGLVLNYPLPVDNGDKWGLDCSLVEEFWFAHREAAEAAALVLASNATVVLGRDVQLYP